MENVTVSNEEKKSKIRTLSGLNVQVDKFAKLNNTTFKNEWMILEGSAWGGSKVNFVKDGSGRTHKLSISVEHRTSEETQGIFFKFQYFNRDGGFGSMNALKLYLILDEKENLEFNVVTYYDHSANTVYNPIAKVYVNEYKEEALLYIPNSEFEKIVKSKKVEYSIRMAYAAENGVLSEPQLMKLKILYNCVIDDEFELDEIYNYLDQNPPTNSSGGCYIATMVYGYYDHPNVLLLRKFRDTKLATNPIGRGFIDMYYKTSPHLVEYLKDKKSINIFIKKVLDKIISII
jgi:hypothetical protein